MPCMSVTLEVSKLSGWLKADATCRVEGRACDAGGEVCEPGGGMAWGGERTWNMRRMVVTLEVSQLEMSALKFLKL